MTAQRAQLNTTAKATVAHIAGENITLADFKSGLVGITKHYDTVQKMLGYAVYQIAISGNKTAMTTLISNWQTKQGKLTGDGTIIAAYIKRFTSNLHISQKGEIEVSKTKDGFLKPVVFRKRDQNGSLCAGDINAGFPDKLDAFRLSQIANKKAQNKKKNEKAAGEVGDGVPTGEETAPAPSVDSKSGGPLPFASIIADLEKIKEIIATTGNGYSREDSKTAAGKLQELAHQLLTRDELEAMAEEQKITADEAADMMASA